MRGMIPSSILSIVLLIFNITEIPSPANHLHNYVTENPAPAPSPSPSPNAHDHSWLVLFWPMGYCSEARVQCVQTKLDFTIHGVWPADKTGKRLLNCGTANLEELLKSEKELLNNLLEYWPSLTDPRNDEAKQIEFWQHEYDRHGSCDQLQPLQYLDRAIKLIKDKYHILAALEKQKIKPGNSYSKQDFSKAIKEAIGGHDFFPRCLKKNSKSILREIVICVDSGNVNAISCTAGEMKDNCEETIYFPSAVE